MVALVRHPSNIVCFAGTVFETIVSEVTNDVSEGEKGLFYPGIVNISGTYCFMNSTMQVRPALHPVLSCSCQRIPVHATPRAL